MARPRRGDGLDLNALLQQAAELKDAQLRATRRAYEAAPECVRHTLAYGRDAAVLALRTGHADARLDEAEAHKAAGNAALQADPGRALEQYTRALSLLAWFDKRTAREDEERVILVDGTTAGACGGSEAAAARARRLHATTLLNSGRAYVALGRHGEARAACDGVEAVFSSAAPGERGSQHTAPPAGLDHMHLAKALYWRAAAWAGDGTREGLRRAVEDTRQALRLAPTDPSLLAARASYASQLAAATVDEKKQCGAMFAGSGLYDDVAPAPGRKAAAGKSRARWPLQPHHVVLIRRCAHALLAARLLWVLHRSGLLAWLRQGLLEGKWV